jgi:hypothetical protein
MKTVKDYPVKYKFGYSSAYGGWHSGVDRPAPHGTPVKVNNTIIGLSGNTGYVLPAPTKQNPKAGSHHHLTRLSAKGNFTNPRNSGFKMRSIGVKRPKVVAVGNNSRSGNFVTIQGFNGARWVHCHLSKIYVKVGQVIK